jgi:hypothetical protein
MRWRAAAQKCHNPDTTKAVTMFRSRLLQVLFALVTLVAAAAVHAQDIEPRAYSNAPVGVNFLVAGAVYTEGGVASDTALPVSKPQLETSNGVLAYARTLDLWGTSGKFDVITPYTWLSGSALYHGETVRRSVDGFSDPSFRLSVNLYGAPALSMKDFASYQQDLIVGASLQVIAPWGQYDEERLVNIGTHRWSFKPGFGVSKRLGQWTLEGTAAVTFFTDNDEFFGGHKRAQDPLYSLQWHTIYSFPKGYWASLDATYFTGGRTTIDGVEANDLQRNWRVGGTFAMPIDARNSIKLYASSGVSARTGNSFDLYGIAWQYRWGGGI